MDVWLVCCWVVFWLQHVDNHFVFILNLQIYYGRPLWKFNRKWDILRWYEDLELVRILFSFTYAHDRSTVNFSTNLWIYYGRPLLDFNVACKDLASVEIWQKKEYYFDGTKTLDLSGCKRNFDFLKNLFIDLSANVAAILKSMQNSNYCYDCSQWTISKSSSIGNSCYFAYFSIWPRHYRKGLYYYLAILHSFSVYLSVCLV